MQFAIVHILMVSILSSVFTRGDYILRPKGTLKNKVIAKSYAISHFFVIVIHTFNLTHAGQGLCDLHHLRFYKENKDFFFECTQNIMVKTCTLLGTTGLGGINHLYTFPVDACKTILRLTCFSDEMHVRQGCWLPHYFDQNIL